MYACCYFRPILNYNINYMCIEYTVLRTIYAEMYWSNIHKFVPIDNCMYIYT